MCEPDSQGPFGNPSQLLARASTGAFFVQILGGVVGFALHVTLTRSLGAADYGMYAYALAWIRFVTLPAKLGFDTSSIRYIAAYSSRGESQLLRGFLTRAHTFTVGAGVTLAAALALAVQVLATKIGSDLAAVFVVGSLLIPVRAVLEVQSSLLRGFGRVVLGLGPRDVLYGFILIVLLLLVLSLDTLTANSAMALSVVAAALSVVVASTAIWATSKKLIRGVKSAFKTEVWLRVSLQLLLISSLAMVMTQTDIMMVGAFTGTTDAGIYAIASRLAGITFIWLYSVTAILEPLVAEAHSREDVSSLQQLITRATRRLFFASVASAAVLGAASGWILGLFGPDYVAATRALRILLLGTVSYTAVGSVGALMTMTGHQAQAVRIIMLTAGLNVILNAVLIPFVGIEGAAIATAVSAVVWNVLMTRSVHRLIGIEPLAFPLSNLRIRGDRPYH